MFSIPHLSSFFFFNDTATTEIYTLSLHDALPICPTVFADFVVFDRIEKVVDRGSSAFCLGFSDWTTSPSSTDPCTPTSRSEEHTSELQSRLHLVCRLLLEKKKKNKKY